MTKEQATDLQREVFQADSHCWRCVHRSTQRELDVDRPEGDHLRFADFRVCLVSHDPYQCPAVQQQVDCHD